MNLLTVIHYPIFGGPHNRVLRMSSLLEESGWHSFVVVPNEEGNAAERLIAGRCEVIPLTLHRLRNRVELKWALQFARSFYHDVERLRQVIREKQIDLVLIAGLANPHGAIAAHLEGVPTVWQIIDSRTPPPVRALLMPLVLALADAIMFGGEALIGLHLGSRRINLPMAVCPPAVDASQFRPSNERRLQTRVRLGIPDSAEVVGMVANLNPQKGIEYFVRAASIIARERPDTYFIIVGASYQTQAKYIASIHEEIKKTGIPSSQFILAGDRSDVEMFYPAMDIKLITSLPRSEGTTTTAMEAMACGVPIIAVDVGAVKEVVLDGLTGMIVPALDAEAIAGATIRLLEDPALRSRMTKQGRRRAVDTFDIRVSVDRYLSIFESAQRHRKVRQAAQFLEVKRLSDLHHHPLEFIGKKLLACPRCHGSLEWSLEEVVCRECARTYPIQEGIPVFLNSGTDEASAGEAQKIQQAQFFDNHVSGEFEITRPHGTPRFHKWLLSQKFIRSTYGLADQLSGKTALTVCGGSGMEAEFLANAGAHVIVSDISLGAALRVKERAERFGLPLSAIVADAEHLPFAENAVDLVYVHDGLHHLASPFNGLSEMARVARYAVSVTEPARAVATALAVRLRISEKFEESGNQVRRFRLAEISEHLRARGFETKFAHRYAMYYRHNPGIVTRILSVPGLFPLAALSWTMGNRTIGRLGNKLAVVATRLNPE